MSSESIRDLTDRLSRLYKEALSIEQYLRELGVEHPILLDEERYYKIREFLEWRQREESIYQALAKIDFKDDYYKFVRAIDGDTIVVEPPAPLQQWMKDVHVRLYGLETPELWEEMGEEYRKHLENLCGRDGGSRLMIVWERERLGTQYEGFPLSSFERGIGHVFFPVKNDRYLYVNGLMHILRYSSLKRKNKNLLRGAKFIEKWGLQLPWSGPCATPIESFCEPISESAVHIWGMRPPLCLLLYPKLPSLDPRSSSFAETITKTMLDAQPKCPFDHILLEGNNQLFKEITELRASPFDVPLAHLSLWATHQYGGDS